MNVYSHRVPSGQGMYILHACMCVHNVVPGLLKVPQRAQKRPEARSLRPLPSRAGVRLWPCPGHLWWSGELCWWVSTCIKCYIKMTISPSLTLWSGGVREHIESGVALIWHALNSYRLVSCTDRASSHYKVHWSSRDRCLISLLEERTAPTVTLSRNWSPRLQDCDLHQV